MKQTVLSVTTLNKYIKSIIEEDVLLESVFIQGEISNFTLHSSGHLYFSLKDENSTISCVMFRESAQRLSFRPENGMAVMAFGKVGLYEKQGRYQLYVGLMEAYGAGRLYAMFEALKEKLAAKGYFNEENKKPIPKYVRSVAIVTSPTGAAVRDMIRIAGGLDPSVRLIIVPCLVQGEQAAKSIAHSIEMVNRWKDADAIIVGRGGGSAEDLWAFNEEIVAEAIFKSKIPVVSAVGHETDFTIADFTADFRASTPSSAVAALITPRKDMAEELAGLRFRLDSGMFCIYESAEGELRRLVASKGFTKLFFMYGKYSDSLKLSEKLMKMRMQAELDKLNNRKTSLFARLEEASPLKIMKKGYSVVLSDGKVVKSVKNVEKGRRINIFVSDGSFVGEVLETEENIGGSAR